MLGYRIIRENIQDVEITRVDTPNWTKHTRSAHQYRTRFSVDVLHVPVVWGSLIPPSHKTGNKVAYVDPWPYINAFRDAMWRKRMYDQYTADRLVQEEMLRIKRQRKLERR